MLTQTTFDEAKATQIAGLLLKWAGDKLNYLALIKLLYRIDREALRRWGQGVTTDRYVSMKLGPVTSNIYDLIKSSATPEGHPSFWKNHIQCRGYDLFLVSSPGVSELSAAEESLAKEIFDADGAKDGFALAEACHAEFPEWKDPGGSSTPIRIIDILNAVDASEDDVTHAMDAISIQKALALLTT